MDRKRLEQEIEEAERELEAATRLSGVRWAARRLQRAKAELRRLRRKMPGARRHRRGGGSDDRMRLLLKALGLLALMATSGALGWYMRGGADLVGW